MMKNLLAVVILVPFVGGCGALRVQDTYVRADRATFDVVAPIVRNLSDGDPSNDPDLTGVNGRSVQQMIASWELRLEKAEKSLNNN